MNICPEVNGNVLRALPQIRPVSSLVNLAHHLVEPPDRHLILNLPNDVIDADMERADVPTFFELQIKTLFQHAWSEADHDLGYKPGETPLTAEQERLIAFTSEQAWGADHFFNRLVQERGIR